MIINMVILTAVYASQTNQLFLSSTANVYYRISVSSDTIDQFNITGNITAGLALNSIYTTIYFAR
jgi:hypothetical protein